MDEIKIYKCYEIDNPFEMRQGETIGDLDKYVQSLNENNINFTQDQCEESKKNFINLNKKE